MVSCVARPSPIVYQRRQPEQSVLYQAVREHLPSFLAAASEAERPVPSFVCRELEGRMAGITRPVRLTGIPPWSITLTVSDVAHRLGQKSHNAYARYEPEVSVPAVDKLARLLHAIHPEHVMKLG